MNTHHHRRPLHHTLRALQRHELRLGFIGGSITAGPANWTDPVISWFVEHFPAVRITVENAAIGATGSDLAVFRAQRELIDRRCDLVFIEFAVNDSTDPPLRYQRAREGLIRKLLAAPSRDLLLAYTFRLDMQESIDQNRLPTTIANFERLAEHYHLGSVWMGLHALREVQLGRFRWDEWLPDNLHPSIRGSLSYAQSVIAFLQQELLTTPAPTTSSDALPLPAPLDTLHWEHAHPLPLATLKTQGPWTLRRSPYPWADQLLDTAAPGAKLTFDFQGRGLALGFDFGKKSAEFLFSLDDAATQKVTWDRPAWCGDSGWFRLHHIGDELSPGPHHVQIEVVHGNRAECTGSNFRLALVGIIP